MDDLAVGCLDIEIPCTIMEQCTHIESGQRIELYGTCGKKGRRKNKPGYHAKSNKTQYVTILAEKKNASVVISLQAASMGAVLQTKLSGIWNCNIESTYIYDNPSIDPLEGTPDGESSMFVTPPMPTCDPDMVKCESESLEDVLSSADEHNLFSPDPPALSESCAADGSTVDTVKVEPHNFETEKSPNDVLDNQFQRGSHDPSGIPGVSSLDISGPTDVANTGTEKNEKSGFVEHSMAYTMSTEEEGSDNSSDENINNRTPVNRMNTESQHKMEFDTKKKNQNVFACDRCERKFHAEYLLKRHKNTHKHTEQLCCPICKRQFKYQLALDYHIQAHSGEVNDFTCIDCSKTFKSKKSLYQHIRLHTGERPFRCETCGKGFADSSNLKAHERIHTGDLPYMCPQCGKRFPANSSLKLHLQIHENARRFKCSVCGKGFNHARARRNHELIHREKSFVCDICGIAFSMNADLKSHRKTHESGPKPHSCQTCGKSFLRKTNLRVHLRQHTGEKPYSCELCDISFKQNVLLKRHIKAAHGHVNQSSDGLEDGRD